MKRLTMKKMVLCGLFAAFTAVCAQISIYIGPVPINFAHLAIFISAGLLGTKYGVMSQVIYVLLGAMGLPVFSGFGGGVGRVVGPTGGYIIGYILTALVVGIILDNSAKVGRKVKCIGKDSIVILFIAMYIGWVAEYVLGTAWYCYVTNTGVAAALAVCVFPFLPGDLAKSIVSAIVIKRLHKSVANMIAK